MFLIITTSYFVAGIEFYKDGSIRRCPPIVYWMQKNNWNIENVKKYCIKKNWEILEYE